MFTNLFNIRFGFLHSGVLVSLCQWKRIALFLIIAMFAFQTPCMAKKPIKIGVSLGLTGRFAVMADALNKGFKLWEQNVNNENGILGRPVRVVVKCQDIEDPSLTVNNARTSRTRVKF